MPTPVDEIKSGDERRALVAMRDMLADRMVEADSNVIAQIAARLQAVLLRLADIGAPEAEVSGSDDVARKREARRAATALAAPGAGSGKQLRPRSG